MGLFDIRKEGQLYTLPETPWLWGKIKAITAKSIFPNISTKGNVVYTPSPKKIREWKKEKGKWKECLIER